MLQGPRRTSRCGFETLCDYSDPWLTIKITDSYFCEVEEPEAEPDDGSVFFQRFERLITEKDPGDIET